MVVSHGGRTHLVVVELVVGGGPSVHVGRPRGDPRQPHLPVDVVSVGGSVVLLVQPREQHVGAARIRVVQAGRRRHEHAVVRRVARRQRLVRSHRRVRREGHGVVLPPQSQEISRRVPTHVSVVVVRVRHWNPVAVCRGLAPELVVGLRVRRVSSRRVPHGVRGTQFDGTHVGRCGRSRCRSVRRVYKRIQHFSFRFPKFPFQKGKT